MVIGKSLLMHTTKPYQNCISAHPDSSYSSKEPFFLLVVPTRNLFFPFQIISTVIALFSEVLFFKFYVGPKTSYSIRWQKVIKSKINMSIDIVVESQKFIHLLYQSISFQFWDSVLWIVLGFYFQIYYYLSQIPSIFLQYRKLEYIYTSRYFHIIESHHYSLIVKYFLRNLFQIADIHFSYFRFRYSTIFLAHWRRGGGDEKLLYSYLDFNWVDPSSIEILASNISSADTEKLICRIVDKNKNKAFCFLLNIGAPNLFKVYFPLSYCFHLPALRLWSCQFLYFQCSSPLNNPLWCIHKKKLLFVFYSTIIFANVFVSAHSFKLDFKRQKHSRKLNDYTRRTSINHFDLLIVILVHHASNSKNAYRAKKLQLILSQNFKAVLNLFINRYLQLSNMDTIEGLQKNHSVELSYFG